MALGLENAAYSMVASFSSSLAYSFAPGLQGMIPVDFGNLIVFAFMIGIIVPVMVFSWKDVKRMPTPEHVAWH